MENKSNNDYNDPQLTATTLTTTIPNKSSFENAKQFTTASPVTPSRVVAPPPTAKVSGPLTVSNNSPAKGLPNIQPKGIECQPMQRQIIPKNENVGLNAQAGGSQAGNVLIRQGVQHVLINGQLYPIIQTANGTHLLIQQPVGQVQQGGKQVFTAQPIQLGVGGLQQVPIQTAVPTQQAQYAIPGQPLASLHPPQPQPLNPGSLPISSTHINSSNNVPKADRLKQSTEQPSSLNTLSSALPISSSQLTSNAPNIVNSTSSSAPNLPTTLNQYRGNASDPNATGANKTSNSQSNFLNLDSDPVTVSPQTQQLLTRIQNQIDAFKSMASLDAEAKKTLAQLQQARQHVLNNVRHQLQICNTPRAPAPVPLANRPMAPGQGPQPVAMQPVPFPQVDLIQSSMGAKELIVKPAADGMSAATEENVVAIINAFANVKVGMQIYNIQLMEEQKRSFAETMSKMNAQQQHAFIVQQQNQILQTVFKNQQQQGQRSAQQQGPQNSMPPQFPSQIPLPSIPQNSQSSAKPNSRSRGSGRRRPASRSKNAGSPASTPLPQPITLPDVPTGYSSSTKHKFAAPKRSKFAKMSTKRIGERLLQQIMRDQEILLKPGSHKKPFTNRNQLKERLLRFHLFYTAEPYKGYRRLQEEQIYETTAHETVLSKDKLIERFRPYAWKESADLNTTAEDLVIAQLLLQDEQDTLANDKLLEQDDIEAFKARYTKPAVEPTPSPEPISPPSTHITAPVPAVSTEDDSVSALQTSSTPPQPVEDNEHKQANKSLKHNARSRVEMSPETDVITRVKRETAREARERRAAKRMSSYGDSSIQALSKRTLAKRGRRGKPPRLHSFNSRESEETRVEPPPISDSVAEVGEELSQSPRIQSSLSDLQENIDTAPADAESVDEDDSVSKDSSELSRPSSRQLDTRQISVEEKSSGSAKPSESASDSEDELIDIGSPPTPPSSFTHPALPLTPSLHSYEKHESTSPTLTSPRTLSSPPVSDGYPSSPRKGFSICSETVIQQFVQPDNSYERENHDFRSSSPKIYHAESNAGEEDMEVNISDHNVNMDRQYSEENGVQSPIDVEDTWENSVRNNDYDSYDSQQDGDSYQVIRDRDVGVDSGKINDGMSVQQWAGETDDPLDLGKPQSEYEDSTDEGEEGDEGGVAVTWEDNTENVPSEAEDTENSEGEEAADMQTENETDRPIMPIRINKTKFGEYMWPSDESNTASPPSIRLKISEPVPPPIKLRIKRDSNDKWEAASSVSSYASAKSSSGDEDSENEQPDYMNQDCEENSEADESESPSERPSPVDGSPEQQYDSTLQSDSGEDSIPFTHYTAHQDEGR